MIVETNREFEIPYNFDPQLIALIKQFDNRPITHFPSFVNCIYMPPYFHDYKTILRGGYQASQLESMTRKEYEKHIDFISQLYPGKIQILLQNPNIIMDSDTVKYYNSLGINKFCSGSLEQSQIVRENCMNSNIVGSITMRVSKEHLDSHPEYKEMFDGFVLHFPFSKSIDSIKALPQDYYYLLLVNAFCQTTCPGAHHWFNSYLPGSKDPTSDGCIQVANWEKTALVNPADLVLFEPYIKIFKLQDRGWTTDEIFRDFILYTSNFEHYPNIDSSIDYYNFKLQDRHLTK